MDDLHDIPSTCTIEFGRAVRFEDKEFTQLVLREPRVKEVLQADEQLRHGVTPSSLRNREMHLVAKVAEIPFPVVEMMPITSLLKGMEYLNRFLSFGQRTGEI